jgi:hypothetical protein
LRPWPENRKLVWWTNPDDTSGEWVPETGRPVKKPRDIRVPRRHFDWLIRRTVLREKALSIAVDAEVDASTVRRAIESVSNLLGE